MNEIISFANDQFGNLRTVMIDSSPWFVGRDVAEKLGYANASKAVMMHVDKEDKQFLMLPVSDSQNGNLVKTALINESGMYALILSSKLPSAKDFKHWVTSDVLPSIRKHGMFATKEAVSAFLADPQSMIALLDQVSQERAELAQTRADLQSARQQLSDAQKKLSAPKYPVFVSADDPHNSTCTVTQLADILSASCPLITRNKLYSRLRQLGLIRQDSCLPTIQAIESGWFAIKEKHSGRHTYYSTGVTSLGILHFMNECLDWQLAHIKKH